MAYYPAIGTTDVSGITDSLNTTEQTPRNIADVLAQALQMLNTTISGLNFINCVVVQTLPTTDISTTTIYLVPKNPSQTDNLYDEYINLTGTSAGWEKIGDTEIDLSGYYTSAEVDDLLADKADVSDIPTVNDGTLTIQQNGETKGTFTANQSGNSTVNIEIPTTDIQTAVDEFETYNGGLLSSCKVALSPNQDLHGYDHPWVGGGGKNLYVDSPNFDNTWNNYQYWTKESEKYNGHDVYSYTNRWQGLSKLLTLPVGTYTFSCMVKTSDVTTLGIYLITGSTTATLSPVDATFTSNTSWTKYSLTFSVTVGGTILPRLENSLGNGVKVYVSEYQLESGSTATAFEPYSNICPITGHTQVDVDVSDGQTTQEQVTVNLGGTYYSGSLDVASGELTVDSAFIASYNGETLPSTWISDRDVYAVGTTPTTGAEVCYKLATPQSIQLSPTIVKALVGENHLLAPLDGQEITESKYKKMFTFDDVIAYIQSLS